jgi:hypothetical protein
MTNNKNVLRRCFFALSMLLAIDYGQAVAVNPNRNKTSWSFVDKSLSELLDDGWKLTNQSVSWAAVPSSSGRDSTGVGTITTDGFSSRMFTFMLSKNNKYIICIIQDPDLAQGTYSMCRSLN